jgi:hypothetical protein
MVFPRHWAAVPFSRSLDGITEFEHAGHETGQEIHMNVRTITQDSAQQGAETSVEEWYRLVAVAAYLRAEVRGFEGGSALDDWFTAEAELKRALSPPGTARQYLPGGRSNLAKN